MSYGSYGEKRPPRGASRPSLTMQPSKAPTDFYVWGNYVAVSPRDIPTQDGQPVYVLVNDRYVLSAVPFDQYPPGQISLSDPQRTWMQVALTDRVKVDPYYDPSAQGQRFYLGAMDVDIGFAGKKSTDQPFDQDELGKHVTKLFRNQIFAPGQKFLTDYKSLPLLMTVKAIKQTTLSLDGAQEAPKMSDPMARGILLENTEINFFKDAQRGGNLQLKASKRRPATNMILNMDFKFESMGIGGLDQEFSTIFRRAFASRLFPPGLVQELGIMHVKGILLHGPPGTGKTLIARQIGKMLNAREPKIINGPEVLNKYVGQSEENIRKLFADAEQEQKAKGDESALHIIIFDELDAVCKQRGSGGGGGTGVGDSVVNQLLSKLDGVDQLNNILLIGMTNRMDMIDEALLRPGRLEMHVEISLPDEHGRVQILGIHTSKLRENGRLGPDVNIPEIAVRTKNFSGAEIAGLCRAAVSWAGRRHIYQGKQGIEHKELDKIQITMSDFNNALEEVKPAFGTAEESLASCFDEGIVEYNLATPQVLSSINRVVQGLRKKEKAAVESILLFGPPGSGKTALAAKAAVDSGFPFVRMITPPDLVGMTDMGKIAHIQKVFTDAYKSNSSVVLLDSLEKLIDYVPVGPRFSASVLGALTSILTKQPPHGRKLLVLATTGRRSELMNQLGITTIEFPQHIAVPGISSARELYAALEQIGALSGPEERRAAVENIIGGVSEGEYLGVGIKGLLRAVNRASDADDLVEDIRTMRLSDIA